ncbi:peptidoglycan-associated lipoprotein Pal [candidate division GN15 bacterium]|uniref:Peptidoglycan-associated lipoprotein n=1 Tax=candidate division GN15 bacterium TaxID=2072418 RepID=A0A855X3M0_9BACT|nr:MAG: peptidoglycan-associated lipoprotein Pal [candidate division GN15 bacterium]
MKKLVLLIVLALSFALLFGGCGKKKEPPVEAPVVQKEEPKPEPPKEEPKKEEPKPTLQESQFQTVYFDFDKYNLRPDAKASLDANYALLKEFPNVIIKIEGNCDERGTVEYNLSLGEKRARAAMDYLVGLGIAANRISIISYGKERPAVEGHNEAAWAKNRRDEFRVISQ